MGKISSDLVNTEFVTTENKDAVKLDEVGEPTDNTNLDSDSSRHGLCPKLSGSATEYLDGSGAFSTPAGTGGGGGGSAAGILVETKTLASKSITGTRSPLSPTAISELDISVDVLAGEYLQIDVIARCTMPTAGYCSMWLGVEVDGSEIATIHDGIWNQWGYGNLCGSLKTGALPVGTRNITFTGAKYDSSHQDFQIAAIRVSVTRYRGSTIEAIESKWRYLGEDSEVGLDALAVYQFDGSGNELNDRSGNGYTLSVGAGTVKAGSVGGIRGMYFDGVTYLIAPDTEDLRIVGAFTLEFIGNFVVQDAATGVIVQCANAGTGLQHNVLYSFNFKLTDNTFLYVYQYGAGGTWDETVMDMYPFDEPHYFAITRSSDGLTVKFYIDGVLVNTGTVTSAPEKDVSGNLQRLRIGSNEYTNAHLKRDVVSSIRISTSELSDNQIANIYKQIAYKGSPLVAKGDILTHDGSTINRLSVDPIDGKVLSTDSTDPKGVTWGEVIGGAVSVVKSDFVDNLNNSELHRNWTEDIPVAGPTITEDDTKLLMSGSSGTEYNWWPGNYNSPNVYTLIEPRDFIAKVHVGSISTDNGHAGGLVLYLSGDKSKFVRIVLRRWSSQYNINTAVNGGSEVNSGDLGQGECWLVLMRRGSSVGLLYSTNSVDNEPDINDMTFFRYVDIGASINYSPNNVAIHSMTFGTPSDFDIHYKKFSLRYGSTVAVKDIKTVTRKWKYLGEDEEIGINALACYQFDGSGNELNDRTDNGYNLTVENGTRYYTAIGGTKALWFNGSMNLLGPDEEALRLVGAATIEFVAYLKPNPSTVVYPIVISGDINGTPALIRNSLFSIKFDTTNKFDYTGQHGSGTGIVCDLFSQEIHDEVHYFAFTRSSDGLTIKLYIDGVLVQTRTADNATEKDVSGNTQRLAIGNHYTSGTNYFFTGAISSVRILSTELTAAQVKAVYDEIHPNEVGRFVDLYDTPDTIEPNKLVKANSAGTALEFYDMSAFNEEVLVSTGETSYVLDYAPLPTANSPFGFALIVKKNGITQKYSSSPTGVDEFGYNSSTKTVSFVAHSGAHYQFIYFGLLVAQAGHGDFIDTLNDGSLHTRWTKDIPVAGTIDEDSSKLSISHAGGTEMQWWSGPGYNAPGAYLEVEPRDFIVKVNVSNVVATNDNEAALMNYIDGTKSSFHRFALRYSGGAYKIFTAYNSGSIQETTVGQDNAWLAIMRRANKYMFLYSLNSVDNEPEIDDMVLYRTIDIQIAYTKNLVSLVGMTYLGNPAIDIHFKKFKLLYGSETPAPSKSLISYEGHEEDRPPAYPSQYDDEFLGNSLKSIWTWYVNTPNVGSEYFNVANGMLNVCTDVSTAYSMAHVLGQDVPSQTFEFYAKFKTTRFAQYMAVGLVLHDSVNDNVVMNQFGAHNGYGGSTGWWINQWVTSWTDFFNGRISENPAMLKIKHNPSTLATEYFYSIDGFNWVLVYSHTLSWTPDKFGLWFYGREGSGLSHANVYWFRVKLL